MSKSRRNWREKQREKYREEMLDNRNYYGANDPVPHLAVKHIKEQQTYTNYHNGGNND